MRQWFVNVLESDDKDPSSEAALRSFWARAMMSSAGARGSGEGQVIDLARFAASRKKSTRT